MPTKSTEPPSFLGPGTESSDPRVIFIEQIHRSPYRATAPAPGPAAVAAWLDHVDCRETVLVRHRALGGYELLVGEFVWRVAQVAACQTLTARVLERIDEGLARQLATLDCQQDAGRVPGAPPHAGYLPWSGGAKVAIARAIRVLRTEQNWSLGAASGLFGLSRSEGAHYTRVLMLPALVLDLIDQGALSFGQARALARLSDWPERVRVLAHKVAALPGTPARARRRPHSVREVERLVAETLRQLTADSRTGGVAEGGRVERTSTVGAPTWDVSRDLAHTERILTERCGFPVQIDFDSRTLRGRLIVRFASLDEFQTLAERLAPGIDFEDG